MAFVSCTLKAKDARSCFPLQSLEKNEACPSNERESTTPTSAHNPQTGEELGNTCGVHPPPRLLQGSCNPPPILLQPSDAHPMALQCSCNLSPTLENLSNIFRRSIENLSDIYRIFGSHGSVLTARLSTFGSHCSVFTV